MRTDRGSGVCLCPGGGGVYVLQFQWHHQMSLLEVPYLNNFQQVPTICHEEEVPYHVTYPMMYMMLPIPSEQTDAHAATSFVGVNY